MSSAPLTSSDIAQSDRELLPEHRRSFSSFSHMVLFAALHIALTLACVALAFIGHSQLIAFLLWLGGTLALIVGVVVHGSGAAH